MPPIRPPAAAPIGLIGLIGLGLVAPAGAEVYRWIDEEGGTVYSQTPPPAGGSTVLRPATGPADPERQQAKERLRTLLEQDLNRQEDRTLAKEKAAQERKAQDAKAASCATARKNLAALERYGRTRLTTPDGRELTLGEDELAARLAETHARIDADCQ